MDDILINARHVSVQLHSETFQASFGDQPGEQVVLPHVCPQNLLYSSKVLDYKTY